MTTPRTTRNLRVLLALGLAATVALPAASALQLASSGNAAADAAWKQAASLGGGGCAGDACTMQYDGLGTLANQGSLGANAKWGAQVETHEKETIDAAVAAAEQLRAEAEAKVREAIATKDRVRIGYTADADVKASGDADAAMDTSGTVGGDAGLDGILSLGTSKRVDLQAEKRIKHETEAKVAAEADSAVQMIADLLADLQGQLTMGVNAAVDAFADAGAAVGGALGLVQSTDVNVHHSLDASASMGSVPRVEVPKLRAPDLGMAGSASLVAQAQAAAGGVVRG